MTKTTEGLPAVTMDGPWPLWCTSQHQMLVVTHIKTHTLLLVIRSRHAPSCSYMVLHFPVKSASQHHPYRGWRLSERLWRTLAASCPPPVFPFFLSPSPRPCCGGCGRVSSHLWSPEGLLRQCLPLLVCHIKGSHSRLRHQPHPEPTCSYHHI